ncbi:MAG: hypothetical protein NTW21_17645 [Verrucomicrobia bacterium]|nr:hypothetical protein [Verrucomicrobiota bacterium]
MKSNSKKTIPVNRYPTPREPLMASMPGWGLRFLACLALTSIMGVSPLAAQRKRAPQKPADEAPTELVGTLWLANGLFLTSTIAIANDDAQRADEVVTSRDHPVFRFYKLNNANKARRTLFFLTP